MSEPESVCNNWRGWKKSSPNSFGSSTGGSTNGATAAGPSSTSAGGGASVSNLNNANYHARLFPALPECISPDVLPCVNSLKGKLSLLFFFFVIL